MDIAFRKHLTDQRLAPNNVRGYLSGIRSCYEAFEIGLPHLPRSGNKTRPLPEYLNIPDKNNNCKALKLCDRLVKAIVLVGVSGELASNEIRI